MRNVKLIFLFGFVILYTNSFAQAQETTGEIDQLENRIEILERRNELLNERFQIKSKSLDLQFEMQSESLENKHNLLEILLWIFGSVSVIGLISFFISLAITYNKLLNKASDIAESKIDNKLSSFFEEKKERFKSLIDQQVEENKLKSNSFIQVLTPKDGDQQFAENFFREMGFKNVKYTTIGSEGDLTQVPDLVFINDEECTVAEDTIEDYINVMPREVVFFYFGKGRINYKHDRLAYANHRLQVYGNLMNALTYQSLLD